MNNGELIRTLKKSGCAPEYEDAVAKLGAYWDAQLRFVEAILEIADDQGRFAQRERGGERASSKQAPVEAPKTARELAKARRYRCIMALMSEVLSAPAKKRERLHQHLATEANDTDDLGEINAYLSRLNEPSMIPDESRATEVLRAQGKCRLFALAALIHVRESGGLAEN